MRIGLLSLSVAAAAACTHHARPDSFVRLERTACLEQCPQYRVTMYVGGDVEYVGGPDAPPGTAWRKVDADEVERLMTAVERIAPWRCEFDCIVIDQPQSILTVARHGQSRRVVHDHGDPCAPRELLELEGAIDRAGGHPQLVISQ